MPSRSFQESETPSPSPTCRSRRRTTGPSWCETQAVGICGTDVEIIDGEYGWAPPGQERLIIGHESLGRVVEAPRETGFSAGDLVVGIVRRPDPCPARRAPRGTGTCAPTAGTPSAGSRPATVTRASATGIHPEYLVAVDPAPRHPRGAARAGHRGGQGLGPHREDRPAGHLGAAGGAGHRGRANRAAGRAAVRPARLRHLRARPGDRGPQAGDGPPARGNLRPPRRPRRGGREGGHRDRVHRLRPDAAGGGPAAPR